MNKMIIEIVDVPIKNGDFPVRYVNVYQRVNYDKLRYSLVHTDGRAGLLEHEHPMLGLLAFDTRCLDCKQQYSLSFHWSTSCSQFGG